MLSSTQREVFFSSLIIKVIIMEDVFIAQANVNQVS